MHAGAPPPQSRRETTAERCRLRRATARRRAVNCTPATGLPGCSCRNPPAQKPASTGGCVPGPEARSDPPRDQVGRQRRPVQLGLKHLAGMLNKVSTHTSVSLYHYAKSKTPPLGGDLGGRASGGHLPGVKQRHDTQESDSFNTTG